MNAGQIALQALQYQVVEPPDLGATWPSGFWTRTEVLWYLNQRQQRFLKDTGIVVGFARQAAALQLQQTLPVDWVQTITLAFITTATGVYRSLPPIDTLEADFGLSTWPSVAGEPQGYTAGDDVSLTIRLIPAPAAPGTLEIVYIALAAAILGDGSAGDLFVAPAEFVPYLLWGTLADMLGKIGRGQDLPRAGYAEGRYQEGVAIARILLYGGD